MRNILLLTAAAGLITFSCASGEKNNETKETASTGPVETKKETVVEDKTEENKIHWMSLEEAQEKIKTEPKKIFIDVYTDWCGPCKMMMKQTFTNQVIIDYINENYYAVKFNAESGDTITFNGKTYTNPNYQANKRGRNSTHQLTYAIASVEGRIAYPTTVYIDENLKLITGIQGFFPPKEIEPILAFINLERYKTDETFDQFKAKFQGKIK